MASPNTNRKIDKTGADLYNTPFEAMLGADRAGIFDEDTRYWDPCAGLGIMSTYLKHIGKSCVNSDINDYGLTGCETKDFFQFHAVPSGVECVIMNPPFRLTSDFLNHALTLCPKVIMFNRATVLESAERSRKHFTREWPLKKFWSFGYRVSCSKGQAKTPTANAVWYGWFEYDRDYLDVPEIGWILK